MDSVASASSQLLYTGLPIEICEHILCLIPWESLWSVARLNKTWRYLVAQWLQRLLNEGIRTRSLEWELRSYFEQYTNRDFDLYVATHAHIHPRSLILTLTLDLIRQRDHINDSIAFDPLGYQARQRIRFGLPLQIEFSVRSPVKFRSSSSYNLHLGSFLEQTVTKELVNWRGFKALQTGISPPVGLITADVGGSSRWREVRIRINASWRDVLRWAEEEAVREFPRRCEIGRVAITFPRLMRELGKLLRV